MAIIDLKTKFNIINKDFKTEKIEEKTSEAGDNLAPFETEKIEEKT
ncbi:MAG: hypothetical protein H8E13_14170, partial [Actinobacteria bacterium]|nr:hypothetical protein [Actinomycetota bacterium]